MFLKSIKIFLLYATLFFLFSQPFLYTLTNQLGLHTTVDNVPSLRGMITHSLLFALCICIIIITMFNSKVRHTEEPEKLKNIRKRRIRS